MGVKEDMKFEVIRIADNRVMFSYVGENIPYDANTINVMSGSGYKFKIDGSTVSKGVVLSMIGSNDARQAAPAITKISNNVPTNTSKKVRCIETNIIYDSQSAAAKALGIDPAQVSDSIKTGRKRSGYTFERVIEEQ